MSRVEAGRGIYPDLPCAAVKEGLHRYIAGEVDPLTARSIQDHLRRCPSCSGEAHILEEEEIAFLEAAVVSPALSPRFAARLVDEIRREETEALGKRKLRRLRSILGAGALAAGIAVAAVGGFLTAPTASPERGGADLSGPIAVRPEMALSGKVCPEDRSRRGGIVLPLASLHRELPATPANLRLNLPDWVEFSASFFPLDELKPCQRDVNHDGQTDISDAAHLFMLAVTPSPADPATSSLDEIDLDCNSLCQI